MVPGDAPLPPSGEGARVFTREAEFERALQALRRALALTPLVSVPALASGGYDAPRNRPRAAASWLAAEAVDARPKGPGHGYSDDGPATSSEDDEVEATRLIALVELARSGDSEAFGMLYDHYHSAIYRFLYYRVGSVALAEDLMFRDVLQGAAERGIVPLAGQGLRCMADDHRPEPDR